MVFMSFASKYTQLPVLITSAGEYQLSANFL